MNKNKVNLWEFFQDVDGGLSFKRLQAAAFTLLFAATIIINLAGGRLLDSQQLEILSALLFYSYTGIVSEKFTKRGMDVPPSGDDSKKL